MLRWLLGDRGRTKRRWKLEAPLLEWAKGEVFSVRDSFSGTCIMGATGSGKSSGSLRHLSCSMIRAGFGGAFLTVKSEDCGVYERYATECGRARDLVVYSPESNPLRFNFIQAEIDASPDPQALADNLTALIMLVASLGDMHRGKSRGSGGGGESSEYFRQASERLCRCALLVLLLSGKPVTMPDLYRLIVSTPRSRDEARDPAWQAESFFFACVTAARDAHKNASQAADFEMAIAYFFSEWADLNDRTRTTVTSTLTAATDSLSRGTTRDSLSSSPESCNFDPEMLYQGKLVILDYPVLVHANVGRLIQVVVKHAITRRHSRRKITDFSRPTFMIVDECQHLLTEQDALFATTARSTRTALVYATQSVSTLLEAFGGSDAEPRMHAFLGNMQLQLHHQQTDTRTIHHLQELTGKRKQLMMSGNTSTNQDWLGSLLGESQGVGSGSGGFSEHWEHELQAADINGLAKGGPPHYYTEAIVYQGGKMLENGRTWRLVRFRQGKKR